MFFWREFCVYGKFWNASKSDIFSHCALAFHSDDDSSGGICGGIIAAGVEQDAIL